MATPLIVTTDKYGCVNKIVCGRNNHCNAATTNDNQRDTQKRGDSDNTVVPLAQLPLLSIATLPGTLFPPTDMPIRMTWLHTRLSHPATLSRPPWPSAALNTPCNAPPLDEVERTSWPLSGYGGHPPVKVSRQTRPNACHNRASGTIKCPT